MKITQLSNRFWIFFCTMGVIVRRFLYYMSFGRGVIPPYQYTNQVVTHLLNINSPSFPFLGQEHSVRYSTDGDYSSEKKLTRTALKPSWWTSLKQWCRNWTLALPQGMTVNSNSVLTFMSKLSLLSSALHKNPSWGTYEVVSLEHSPVGRLFIRHPIVALYYCLGFTTTY